MSQVGSNDRAPREPVPDWLLERYVLGELPSERMASLEARVATDPELGARIEALHTSNAQILQQMPPRVFAASVDQLRRHDASNRAPSRMLLLVPVFAVAAATLLAVPVMLDGGQPYDPGVEVTRLKGDAGVVVHRQGPDGVEVLADGAHAAAGDRLQLSVKAGDYAYGAVLSVDGRGTITVHQPRRGTDAVALSPGATVSLGQSYELDDAPGFERFFLVASPQPFEVGVAVDAVDALGDAGRLGVLDLPAPMAYSSVVLDKE